jgi:hypothetical protein
VITLEKTTGDNELAVFLIGNIIAVVLALLILGTMIFVSLRVKSRKR